MSSIDVSLRCLRCFYLVGLLVFFQLGECRLLPQQHWQLSHFVLFSNYLFEWVAGAIVQCCFTGQIRLGSIRTEENPLVSGAVGGSLESLNALEVFLYFPKMLKGVPCVNMDTWLVVSLFVYVQFCFSLDYEGKEWHICSILRTRGI